MTPAGSTVGLAPLTWAAVEVGQTEQATTIAGVHYPAGWPGEGVAVLELLALVLEPTPVIEDTFVVTLTEAGRTTAVGLIGLKDPAVPASTVEIAYSVSPQWQGRGVATQAVMLLCDRLRLSGVTEVQAQTEVANEASARVLVKCGFSRTGRRVEPHAGLCIAWSRRLTG